MAEAVYLQDAVTRYLSRRAKQVAAHTYRDDRGMVLRLQRFIGGNPRMSAITADRVFDFFYGDEDEALSNLMESSFNVARGRVSQFLKYCERRNWVDPFLMDEIGTKQVPEQNQRRFTASELSHLISSVKAPQERILVSLACNTALRVSDITSLRICAMSNRGEIDAATPTVDLAGGWLHVRISKTHNQDDLPITRELDQDLRAWLTHYGEKMGRPLEPGMFLVPAKNNAGWGAAPDRDYRYNPFNQISSPDDKYRRFIEAAGLPYTKGNGFHTLRRSFARIFYEELKVQGHPDPIKVVQAALHHATPEMTYRYIGVALDRATRNEVLRGMAFLSRLAADTSNVTQLRPAGQA